MFVNKIAGPEPVTFQEAFWLQTVFQRPGTHSSEESYENIPQNMLSLFSPLELHSASLSRRFFACTDVPVGFMMSGHRIPRESVLLPRLSAAETTDRPRR